MRAAVYFSRCPCCPCPCRVVSGSSNVDPVAKPKVLYPSVVESTSTVFFSFALTTTGSLVSTSRDTKMIVHHCCRKLPRSLPCSSNNGGVIRNWAEVCGSNWGSFDLFFLAGSKSSLGEMSGQADEVKRRFSNLRSQLYPINAVPVNNPGGRGCLSGVEWCGVENACVPALCLCAYAVVCLRVMEQQHTASVFSRSQSRR